MKKKTKSSADVSNIDKSKYIERRKFRLDSELPLSALARGDSDAIINFFKSSSDEFGGIPDPENLKMIQNVTTPTRRIIRYQQLQDTIPILDSYVLTQLDKTGKVKQLDLGVTSKTNIVKPHAAARDTKITAQEAIKYASSIGDFIERERIKEPEIVYYPTRSGLRLAYKVLILTREPAHDWRIIIDTHTGEVLEKRDLIFEVDGQGRVFDPNPVVTANDNTYRDPTATVATCNFAGTAIATIDSQLVDRVLKDITFSGGVHKLEGPYVKLRNFSAPNVSPPEEADPNNFKYSSGDQKFEHVMVYYHIDTIQRYIQSLGITTALNSQIEADAHDNSSIPGHGAFYSPGDLGIHFGDSDSCRPDRGEEADAIVHEYGHAIQDNQVPGWGVPNPVTTREETRAMGEGFGDILACVYFAEMSGGFQREVFEDWVFADRAGLRRVDGTKIYPTDWNFEEHDDGEIWSAALWNIYRMIGGDSTIAAEREAAKDAILKSVILSHHRLSVDSSMPDGAEAVMEENAELDDYRGKHLMQMLDSFHDRGLLVTSSQADLYIREASDDLGVDSYLGPVFWDSPDLWLRNSDDGIQIHQNPKHGQDNWFYARVHNRGTFNARAFVVTFNVKPWAGTQFLYPQDFVPYVSAGVGFNLAPGGSAIVKAKWPNALVPSSGTGDQCILASVYMPTDVSPTGRHVWEHNNLAQKNVTIVNLMANDSTIISFDVGSMHAIQSEVYRIEVRRPQEWINLPISIVHKDPKVINELFNSIEKVVAPTIAPGPSIAKPVLHFVDQTRTEILPSGKNKEPIRINFAKGSTLEIGTRSDDLSEQQAESIEFSAREREAIIIPEESDRTDHKSASIVFKSGPIAGFPTVLKPRSQVRLGLKITAPTEATHGDVLKIHLVQRNRQGLVVGGIAVQLNIK
jgi:hypothetical protein